MTDLIVRKLRFAFADHDVPFLWNEANPAFSSMANAVSFLAIGFEKMIGSMIPERCRTSQTRRSPRRPTLRAPGGSALDGAPPTRQGTDQAYPALKETLDKVIESYDDLTAGTPLKYRLAYTADLEATFTPPVFKLMLDHDDTLFAPGDDRVASLFLWHFVEEVEHRAPR